MKFRTLAILFLSASTILLSSAKEFRPAVTTFSMQGLWIGTYSVNGQPELGERYFSFDIKADGTIIMEGMAENVTSMATGTWTMNGKDFSASYIVTRGLKSHIGMKQKVWATFDNSGKLTGLWSNVNTSTEGTFTLYRINDNFTRSRTKRNH